MEPRLGRKELLHTRQPHWQESLDGANTCIRNIERFWLHKDLVHMSWQQNLSHLIFRSPAARSNVSSIPFLSHTSFCILSHNQPYENPASTQIKQILGCRGSDGVGFRLIHTEVGDGGLRENLDVQQTELLFSGSGDIGAGML